MKCAILAAVTCCAIAGIATGADTTPQKKAVTPAQKAAPAATKKGSPTPAGHPAPTAANRTSPATAARTPAKTGARTVSPRRYYSRRSYSPQQTTPTADRYREIQDALAAKGYLKTPSSGVWDKDSIDAMQRFQQDQNLEPTGKLTARSLGALGLGPKTPIAANTNPNPSGEASPLQ